MKVRCARGLEWLATHPQNSPHQMCVQTAMHDGAIVRRARSPAHTSDADGDNDPVRQVAKAETPRKDSTRWRCMLNIVYCRMRAAGSS